jgi:hypothetical protein
MADAVLFNLQRISSTAGRSASPWARRPLSLTQDGTLQEMEDRVPTPTGTPSPAPTTTRALGYCGENQGDP